MALSLPKSHSRFATATGGLVFGVFAGARKFPGLPCSSYAPLVAGGPCFAWGKHSPASAAGARAGCPTGHTCGIATPRPAVAASLPARYLISACGWPSWSVTCFLGEAIGDVGAYDLEIEEMKAGGPRACWPVACQACHPGNTLECQHNDTFFSLSSLLCAILVLPVQTGATHDRESHSLCPFKSYCGRAQGGRGEMPVPPVVAGDGRVGVHAEGGPVCACMCACMCIGEKWPRVLKLETPNQRTSAGRGHARLSPPLPQPPRPLHPPRTHDFVALAPDNKQQQTCLPIPPCPTHSNKTLQPICCSNAAC